MLKTIMVLLIFIHGLIHLLGLVRAFSPEKINQYGLPVVGRDDYSYNSFN